MKKKRMRDIHQPKDLVLNLEGMGQGSKITFVAYGYAYGKGADGRMQVQMARQVTGGSSSEPDLKMSMELNTCLWGMSYNDLKKLSQWAAKAAEFVKDLNIHDGYPANRE
jgi:hypothetical protein